MLLVYIVFTVVFFHARLARQLQDKQCFVKFNGRAYTGPVVVWRNPVVMPGDIEVWQAMPGPEDRRASGRAHSMLFPKLIENVRARKAFENESVLLEEKKARKTHRKIEVKLSEEST